MYRTLTRRLCGLLPIAFLVLGLVIAGCAKPAGPSPDGVEQAEHDSGQDLTELPAVSLGPGEKLGVVATTNIVGDIVRSIGGDDVELHILTPVGVDPHAFVPTPKNQAQVSDADVVFANGAGLEEFLEPLLASADATSKAVFVSQGVEFLDASGERSDDARSDHDHAGADPHTWTDPNNVLVWVDNIQRALSALDPDNADAYRSRATAVTRDLQNLDEWVRGQVALIPTARRQIVTDHRQFGYFSERYGFDQVGTIIPGYSTTAEPSVRELAQLEDAIADLGVETLFVGKTVNPALAERVAQDTGTRIVFLYTGSLTEPDGEAGSYVDYVRYNVSAIVDALK